MLGTPCAFETAPLEAASPGPLAPLAERAVKALMAAKQTVAVAEATCGGLIQAALQSVGGASAVTTCGAVAYAPKNSAALLGGLLLPEASEPSPKDATEYIASKRVWTARAARAMRQEVGATWCVSESGACGPTFRYDGLSRGFTAVFISGPVEKGVHFESDHADREANMFAFARAALDLLAQCVEEAAAKEAAATGPRKRPRVGEEAGPEAAGEHAPPPSSPIAFSADRYGGIVADVAADAGRTFGPAAFSRALGSSLGGWVAEGKRGVWLTIPSACAHLIGVAIHHHHFTFHHAKPEYVLLTRWLPTDVPSPLPRYAFTQIGVGGVVCNPKGEVLMCQERVSPVALYQNSWKLPGGLADPGEDFGQTVEREVREETGVVCALDGVVSIRHTHGYRFGMGDLYVIVRLRATSEAITIDEHELLAAQWMSREEIEARAAPAEGATSFDGKVAAHTLTMIDNALDGALIEGNLLPAPNGRRASMLYAAKREGPAR